MYGLTEYVYPGPFYIGFFKSVINTRTMKETSFVYQDKRGFFLHFGQILSKYGQIGDWIGLRSSFAAASEPDFCVFGAR